MRVISPTAAHQVAAVGLLSCFVAQAALRSHAAGQSISLAVVGRSLDVDQLRVLGLAVRVGFLDLEEGRAFVAAGSHRFHVHGLVVFVFEDVSKLAKLGQRRPAGLGGAGSRHAVALTLQTHSFLQDLEQLRKRKSCDRIRLQSFKLKKLYGATTAHQKSTQIDLNIYQTFIRALSKRLRRSRWFSLLKIKKFYQFLAVLFVAVFS